MRIGKKIALTLLALLVVLMTMGYLAGRSFFREHYFPGTNINGRDCSFMTVREVEDIFDREARTYALAVDTMNNGREAVTAEDVGMRYASDGSAGRFLDDQDLDYWFLHLTDKKELNVENRGITVSYSMIEQKVDSLYCMQPENITYPSDAYIKNDGDDVFSVVPEVVGNALDRQKVIDVIRDAVENRVDSVNLETEGCYLKPTVYSDSPVITTSLERIEKFKEALITYDFLESIERLDWSTLRDWLTTDEEGYVILDPEKVKAFVHGLAEKYNTYGHTRDFLTYNNRNITVTGGDYGWLIDEPKETKALTQALEEGTVDVREPVYAYEAASRSGVSDIGMTYIEIDLMNLRLVFYREGQPVVDTEIESNHSHVTGVTMPLGVYTLNGKKSPAEVVENGEIRRVDYLLEYEYGVPITETEWYEEPDGEFYGEPDGELYEEPYEEPDGEFDDELHLPADRSIGVKVPYEAMATLYSQAEEGIPIVIYDE